MQPNHFIRTMVLCAVLLVLIQLPASCQYINSDEEPITYLDDNRNFPYLDEDYNIRISSEKFDSLWVVYKRNVPESGMTYRDSLGFILALKHQGYNKGYRMEMLRATYDWERVGFYLYIDEQTAKDLRKQFNVKTPYDVVAYFRDSTKTSTVRDHYLERLKKLCFQKTNDSTAYHFTNERELLNYAFRIDARERLKEEHRRRGIKPHTH